MGHYDSAYEYEYAQARQEKKEVLTELAKQLEQLKYNVRSSHYYNEHTPLYHRLQEASFWLKNDIP